MGVLADDDGEGLRRWGREVEPDVMPSRLFVYLHPGGVGVRFAEDAPFVCEGLHVYLGAVHLCGASVERDLIHSGESTPPRLSPGRQSA